ncbi:MAG: hypothetical protein R6V28_07240 [Nitriliruptoraceae bacterium]
MRTVPDARRSTLVTLFLVAVAALVGCSSDGEAAAEDLVGAWATSDGIRWVITEDSIAASESDEVIVESTYTATASTFEMADVSGPRACPESQIGTYEWEITDDVLSLTVASDGCGGRASSLDGISFERTGPSASESADSGASGEFAADAVDFPLDAAGGTLDPGTYLVDLLGTEVQFTTSDPWRVAMAEDGALIVEWPEAPRAFTRALLMLRPVDPAAGAEVYDPDGMWVDELSDVEVLDRGEVTIGDTGAAWLDVTATAGAGEVPFLDSPAVGTIVLRDSEVSRVWIIDQGGSPASPMMFFAPVLTDDTEWLSEADAVAESMVFGPVQ